LDISVPGDWKHDRAADAAKRVQVAIDD